MDRINKWLIILMACAIPSFFSGAVTSEIHQRDTVTASGYFEGEEPFWDIDIKDNLLVLRCHAVNRIEKDTIRLSKMQAHTETFAFHAKNIFGILRRSSGNCTLDITEEGNPTHEIYFSYLGVTYMGCGKMTISR
ncbi:hypothetical protein [Sphingobacterium suaedae]|uniref:Uncharacterized protein n=1 Tax=Sphingobacterium suaedae TaxID=1686402 RepID=A0ABW5KN76_9SPHI